MQINYLHKNVYRLYSWARTQECLDVYRKLYQDKVTCWDKLKKENVSDKLCQDIVGISRATYFRYKKILNDLNKGITPPSKAPKKRNKPHWGESERQSVLKIRRENPTYGKDKIAVILARDHAVKLSVSTVGRILKDLKEKGLVQKSSSALSCKRKRQFSKGHAIPWTFKKYEDMEVGERVQIDHMTVSKNGVCIKHFQAWDRKSKYMMANVYSNAKSSSAKRFLKEFVANCPFKIQSIQVDGGSEFMADFEKECALLKIPLFVLPPRKPTYNGGVERGNRTFKEEFYYSPLTALADSIGAFRGLLAKALLKYNSYRPHSRLQGLTPLEYIRLHNLEGTLLSHSI
jgi:Fe2+ or Zn2+ uptake regulation protein